MYLVVSFLLLSFSRLSSEQPQTGPIILEKNNESQISLALDAAPIFTAQSHTYKRQLYSSIQILDLGQLALLKQNILNQISKYKTLKIFNVHGNFVSRKDLLAEYFFSKRTLNFPACKQLCLSKDAHMVSSKLHLQDLKKLTPRSRDSFWVQTFQKAETSRTWKAHYNIFFNGIRIETDYKELNATCPRYFFLNEKRDLQQISSSNLAPLLKYFDTMENKYWVKSFPELQIKFDLHGNITVLYPAAVGSIIHPDYRSQCICSRSLQSNYFKLKRAQKIVQDAQLLLDNLPLKLENSRIQEYNQKLNNISVVSVLSNTYIPNTTVRNPSGIVHPHRLKDIFIQENNSSILYDINHLQNIIQYLSLLDNIPLNFSQANLEAQSNPLRFDDKSNITTQQRNKRLALQILKSIPFQNIFTKILKIGSPYIFKQFQPFQKMGKLFSAYFDLKNANKILKIYASSNASDPKALALARKNNIYNLTFKEKFESINDITTPGLYQATELYRASFLLDYTYRRLMTNIPGQIFQNLQQSLNLNIHGIKIKMQQKGSILLLHYVFEADVPFRKIENFHFRALPHAIKDNHIINYRVPANYSPILSPFHTKYDKCVGGLVHHDISRIHTYCPIENTQNQDFITHIYSYMDRVYLLIKGPSELQAKCLQNPSQFFKVNSDFAFIGLGGGCKIEVSHKNLKGKYEVGPSVQHFPHFEIIHQYNLITIWSQQDYARLGLIICIIVICFGILLGACIIIYGLYFHSRFKIRFESSIEKTETSSLPPPPPLQIIQEQGSAFPLGGNWPPQLSNPGPKKLLVA